MTDIKANLESVIEKIKIAETKAGRKEGSVKLLAVSKFHPVEEIKQTLDAGQLMYGENRVQEACEKFALLNDEYKNIDLHLIGQLQLNKVKKIIQYASTIESVDRIELLEEIEKQCARINRKIKILFELHTGEESKSGFESKQQIEDALERFAQNKYPHIIPSGFMTMAPFTDDKNLIRKSFITLKTVAKDLQIKYPMYELTELSMGMSNDYEIAIEEGSTIVRIGTAIFGERTYNK